MKGAWGKLFSRKVFPNLIDKPIKRLYNIVRFPERTKNDTTRRRLKAYIMATNSVHTKGFNRLKNWFRPIDLTKGVCWKVILSFSVPIILSYLLQQIYTISDAAIVGQTLASEEVAGINDTASLVFIFLQFAFGCSAGFCVITARRVGAGDKAGIRKSFAAQIFLTALLSLILTGISLLLLNPMLAWIHVTPDNPAVYRAAFTYCAIIFTGITAQMFYNFICSFLRSLGDSFTPLVFLLFSTLLNVGLDLLFILVFGWGVAGAAVATVLAQFVSTMACFLYTFSKYKDLRLHREDFRLKIHDLTLHLGLGIPLGLQFSVLAIGIIVMQSVVVKFDILDGVMISQAAQNGYGAANKLLYLLTTPLNGLGVAMTSFTSQNLGAGDTERIRRGSNQSILIMLVIVAAIMTFGLLLTINGAYLYLFLSADKVTAETIRFGNSFLYTDLSMCVFLGGIYVIRNCVQGIGKSRAVLLAGAAELVARVLACLFLAPLAAGGSIDAESSTFAFYVLSAADPLAWIASDSVLIFPYVRNILKKNYRYAGLSEEKK